MELGRFLDLGCVAAFRKLYQGRPGDACGRLFAELGIVSRCCLYGGRRKVFADGSRVLVAYDWKRGSCNVPELIKDRLRVDHVVEQGGIPRNHGFARPADEPHAKGSCGSSIHRGGAHAHHGRVQVPAHGR